MIPFPPDSPKALSGQPSFVSRRQGVIETRQTLATVGLAVGFRYLFPDIGCGRFRCGGSWQPVALAR